MYDRLMTAITVSEHHGIHSAVSVMGDPGDGGSSPGFSTRKSRDDAS